MKGQIDVSKMFMLKKRLNTLLTHRNKSLLYLKYLVSVKPILICKIYFFNFSLTSCVKTCPFFNNNYRNYVQEDGKVIIPFNMFEYQHF